MNMLAVEKSINRHASKQVKILLACNIDKLPESFFSTLRTINPEKIKMVHSDWQAIHIACQPKIEKRKQLEKDAFQIDYIPDYSLESMPDE